MKKQKSYYKYSLSTDNIHIEDSYTISKKEYNQLFNEIEEVNKKHKVGCLPIQYRSRFSLKLETASHTLLYNLNIQRSRTKDVDLDYPQEWYYKVGYFICGIIGLIFIK